MGSAYYGLAENSSFSKEQLTLSYIVTLLLLQTEFTIHTVMYIYTHATKSCAIIITQHFFFWLLVKQGQWVLGTTYVICACLNTLEIHLHFVKTFRTRSQIENASYCAPISPFPPSATNSPSPFSPSTATHSSSPFSPSTATHSPSPFSPSTATHSPSPFPPRLLAAPPLSLPALLLIAPPPSLPALLLTAPPLPGYLQPLPLLSQHSY